MYYGDIFFKVLAVVKACYAHLPESVFLKQLHILVKSTLNLILHYLGIDLGSESAKLNGEIIFGYRHQLTCYLVDDKI